MARIISIINSNKTHLFDWIGRTNNKLKKILNLCEEFKKNNNIDLTITTAKPPIFWKEKEITKKQVLSWTPKKIKETLYEINNIELSIKKNYDNSINLITDFILNLVSKKSNS